VFNAQLITFHRNQFDEGDVVTADFAFLDFSAAPLALSRRSGERRTIDLELVDVALSPDRAVELCSPLAAYISRQGGC